MALHNSGIGVWRHDNSPYGLVVMSPSANLPRCVMPFWTHAHAFSLYDSAGGHQRSHGFIRLAAIVYQQYLDHQPGTNLVNAKCAPVVIPVRWHWSFGSISIFDEEDYIQNEQYFSLLMLVACNSTQKSYIWSVSNNEIILIIQFTIVVSVSMVCVCLVGLAWENQPTLIS